MIFVGEFPPSNHHGGAILVRRLLDAHPTDSLWVVTSKIGMKISAPTGLLNCAHIVLPYFGEARSRLMQIVVRAANWLLLVPATLRIALEIRRNRMEILVSIIQGRYYLAAALAAWLTSTPHITIVHDNFTAAYLSRSRIVQRIKLWLTNKILRRAARVYTVSLEMQQLVLQQCGVQSEVQWPATATPHRRDTPTATKSSLVILFAGLIGYTVKDSLDLLAGLVKTGQLEQIRLNLYSSISDEDMRTFGWDHHDIVCQGWTPQHELAEALANADILFLPYSFSEGAREAVTTAFPSKTADYLAAGKPILVFGPKYSSLVRYACEQGFAEIVDEFAPQALAQGLQKVISSPRYREKLGARALEVFSANHDIETQRRKFYSTIEGLIGTPDGAA